MDTQRRYVFGPVPSRRLGRSLGVDLVPFKTCSFDCVYCQLGRTTTKTRVRKAYVSSKDVVREVAQVLEGGAMPDYVTLSGSGEPTLHSELGEMIQAIKGLTDIPVAVLTNGSLLGDRQVRRECALADLILPTLAAVRSAQYRRIHRPCPGLRLDAHIAGIGSFHQAYKTPIWLELFLLKGINTHVEDLERFAEIIDWIKPEKVQLNTAVRPTLEANALTVPRDSLENYARMLGPNAEVIADYVAGPIPAQQESESAVVALCRRRPCTLDEIASSLGIHRNHVSKYLARLVKSGRLTSKALAGRVYYTGT